VVRVQESAKRVVVTDVTVIDGTGAAPVAHQDVVVEDGRITAIDATGAVVSEAGDIVVDGAGKTLLPGFTDAHVHVGGAGAPKGPIEGFKIEETLERMVAMGITTACDMGGDGREMRTWSERTEDGTVVGPRLMHTHLVITAIDGYPIGVADELMDAPAWMVRLVLPQVGDADDIDAVLDDVDAVGVDYVKIMADRMPSTERSMDHGLLKDLISASRRRHHMVVVHAGHVDDAVVAAGAGAEVLAHLPWRGRFTPEQLAALKASGTAVVATAGMWETTTAVLEGRFKATPHDEAMVPKALRDSVLATPRGPKFDDIRQELVDNVDNRRQNLKDLIAAGVPVLVGTDTPIPGTWPGSSYATEQQALLAAGMTPMQLIVAMTSLPARIFGAGNVGVIAVGRRADLVLVPGDPLSDPTVLTRPALVFRAGERIDFPKGLPKLTAPAPTAPTTPAPPPPPTTTTPVDDVR
jgi:imidazolonepropionase-like amidohydrolase